MTALNDNRQKKITGGCRQNHQNGEISSRQILGQSGLQGVCYCFLVFSITDPGIWRIWSRAIDDKGFKTNCTRLRSESLPDILYYWLVQFLRLASPIFYYVMFNYSNFG